MDYLDAFIMPAIYHGKDAGITVQFAGLNDEPYEKLELSIDGSNFVEVNQSSEDPF